MGDKGDPGFPGAPGFPGEPGGLTIECDKFNYDVLEQSTATNWLTRICNFTNIAGEQISESLNSCQNMTCITLNNEKSFSALTAVVGPPGLPGPPGFPGLRGIEGIH